MNIKACCIVINYKKEKKKMQEGMNCIHIITVLYFL